MSEVTGVVEATSTKFGKFSVLVNEKWYSTKQEWAPTPRPERGDTIAFNDKGSKFLNNCKIVRKGEASESSSGGGVSGYSNLGVEIGHASKLAVDMANTRWLDSGMEGNIGDDEWYEYFVSHTHKIYVTMHTIREAIKKAGMPVVSVVETGAAPLTPLDRAGDIFDD